MNTQDADAVRVAVRSRPLLSRELSENECVRCVEKEIVIGDRRFTFDSTFDSDSTNDDVFKIVEPLVQQAFAGYNATVLCKDSVDASSNVSPGYGQTGSGKTYTMGSDCTSIDGIIPSVIDLATETIAKKLEESPKMEISMHVQFIEIYGDQVRDLLCMGAAPEQEPVRLREQESGEIIVTNAQVERADDKSTLLDLLRRGCLRRTTGSTNMNHSSSRSHAIYTLFLEQRCPMDTEGEEPVEGEEPEMEYRCAKFHFVDLAGSERAKRTQATGKRFKEGVDINMGLLALGNVISALGDDKKRGKVHVPYRDSKLTFFLQDSLGGNSKTLMIACVSPAESNFEETLNTLKYANRARNIKNKPKINRDERSSQIAELKRKVKELTQLLRQQNSTGMLSGPATITSPSKCRLFCPQGMVMLDEEDVLEQRRRADTAEDALQRIQDDAAAYRKSTGLELDEMQTQWAQAQAEAHYYRTRWESTAEGKEMIASSDDEKQKAEIAALQSEFKNVKQFESELLEKDRLIESLSRELTQLREQQEEDLDISLSILHDGQGDLLAQFTDDQEDEEEEEDHEIDVTAVQSEKVDAESLEKVGGKLSPIASEAADATVVPTEKAAATVVAERKHKQLHHNLVKHKQLVEQAVKDIDNNIGLKKKLIGRLQLQQKHFDSMKEAYEHELLRVNGLVKTTEEERNELVQKLEALNRCAEQQRKHSEGELKARLKETRSQLEKLKKDRARVQSIIRLKERREREIGKLQRDVTDLKKIKTQQLRKTELLQRQYRDAISSSRKEIAQLRRIDRKHKQELCVLQRLYDKKDRVLARKTEHAVILQRRLRQLRNQLGSKQHSLTKEEAEKKDKLKRMLKAAATKQKRLEELERQCHRKMQTMERMAKLKSQTLEIKRNASKRMPQSSPIDLCATVRRPKASEPVVKEESGDDDDATPIKAVEAVQLDFEEAVAPTNAHLRELVISPVRIEQQLSFEEKETLAELEEQIEAHRHHLEYDNQRIEQITALVDEANTEERDQVSEDNASIDDKKVMMKMLFQTAVDVKKKSRLRSVKITQLECSLQEKEQELLEIQNQLMLLQQQTELRVTRLQEEHQSEIGLLIGSTRAESTPIKEKLSTSCTTEMRKLLKLQHQRIAQLETQNDDLIVQLNTSPTEKLIAEDTPAPIATIAEESKSVAAPKKRESGHTYVVNVALCDLNKEVVRSQQLALETSKPSRNAFARLADPSNFTGVSRVRYMERKKRPRNKQLPSKKPSKADDATVDALTMPTAAVVQEKPARKTAWEEPGPRRSLENAFETVKTKPKFNRRASLDSSVQLRELLWEEDAEFDDEATPPRATGPHQAEVVFMGRRHSVSGDSSLLSPAPPSRDEENTPKMNVTKLAASKAFPQTPDPLGLSRLNTMVFRALPGKPAR